MIDGSEGYNDQIHKINGLTKSVFFNKNLNLRIKSEKGLKSIITVKDHTMLIRTYFFANRLHQRCSQANF